MNASERIMNRVAQLERIETVREKALRSVAEEVRSCLPPDVCRTMAIGIADLLSNIGEHGTTDTAPEHSGWAIATLLRIAEIQDNAVSDAELKTRTQEIEHNRQSVHNPNDNADQNLATVLMEQQEIKANAEAILFSISQVEKFAVSRLN